MKQNPSVPPENILVDGYDFDAYELAGFSKEIGDLTPTEAPAAPKGWGPGRWYSYVSNVMAMSPIPKDMKFGETPRGVLRLGGTYVLGTGKEIKYGWTDKIPGDHPDLDEVIAAARA